MTASAPPAAATLHLHAVTVRYDMKRALDAVTLEVARGECLLLLGANGAGKSTLMAVASGRIRPESGTVSVCGHDLRTGGPRARAAIGVVAHESFLHQGLTVRENLSWMARAMGIRQPEDRVRAVVDALHLAPFAGQPCASLSRGQSQRAAIARALLPGPALLLLDEPFTGLDEHGRAWLADFIARQAGQGRTVILTSHETAHAAKLATRACLLERGRKVADGPLHHHPDGRLTGDGCAAIERLQAAARAAVSPPAVPPQGVSHRA